MSTEKVKLIRSLINDDPRLKSRLIDDNLLISLLNCEHNDVTNAFSRLKKYSDSRSKFPRFFGNFESALKLLEHKIVTIDFERRTQLNQIVVIACIKNWNPDVVSEQEIDSGIMTIVELVSIKTSDPILMVMDVVGEF